MYRETPWSLLPQGLREASSAQTELEEENRKVSLVQAQFLLLLLFMANNHMQ